MRAHNNLTRIALTILIGAASLTNLPVTQAATVSATGTNPSICNQEVNSNVGVTAERLANGDCLIQFKSSSTSYSWTAPSGLNSLRILIVGGGGGGGAGRDNGSGGGGGAGQVKELMSQRISQRGIYSISVGSGGIAGVGVATYPSESHAGAGQNSEISINGSSIVTALGGNPGGGSRIVTPGAANSIPSGGIGGTAATSSVASQGGSRGSYLGGGGGGGGSSANGGTGAAGAGGAGGAGGSGTTSVILDSALTTNSTFGVGGAGGVPATTLTGSSGGANTGNGGKGAGAGPNVGADGGAGGSGIVVIRYSTTAPTVNSFALSGNPTVATFRAATTININVSVASRVTFLVNGKRIGGCVSLAATGSSSSFTTSCPWKPTTKGAMLLTAQIDPSTPGLAGFTTNLPISVVTRSSSR